MRATYWVKNDHTFGYTFPEQPNMLGVLASKPQLGACLSEEPQLISPSDKMRKATVLDFDFFRVVAPATFKD